MYIITDKQISIKAVAMNLYSRGLSSFELMSECGKIHWIEKIGNNAKELVDSELNKNKTNGKWRKEADKLAKKYRT
jgi:hypothetical protein